jgi:hypothetical protein
MEFAYTSAYTTLKTSKGLQILACNPLILLVAGAGNQRYLPLLVARDITAYILNVKQAPKGSQDA